jgi:hypothetical protein
MLYQRDKSAVAEHSTESDHWIEFQETEVQAKISGYMHLLVSEHTLFLHECFFNFVFCFVCDRWQN